MFKYSAALILLLCIVGVTFAGIENCLDGATAKSCANLFADPAKCTEPSLKSIAEKCPVSCGLCDSMEVICEDTGLINCASAKAGGRCFELLFRTPMEVHCGKTCNLCGPNTGKYIKGENKDLCSDLDKEYCQKNEDLCNKQDSYEMMTEKCPSTCQRCQTH